ncbi:hypothetical protein [Streptomonospora litoralis]|uniref:Uncharacterized protein n=1 Tax=Streptomonospora litoralis TaxID=2498135 RepID=A0A4P6Q4Y2_9ACTN|nr:hypothetical protein [Streptomonospora litoralis]QBI53914.1 hypothetical protein EKD16_10640 [Streptomonospora litoralis]
MGTRRNWIERKARQVVGGRLNGMGGGAPVSRTHRPHRTGGAAPTRGLGGFGRPSRTNRGTGARTRRGGGMPPEVQRGIRQVEGRLRRALRRR